MSYGWGWRGSYGHEDGAMLPGALVGMAVCLGSRRVDWHRRTALAGLCGAVGWSWGGSLSNMEHTFYVVSDSGPDVVWAFACIFLVGMLWSGIGSAVLSFALTLPRSVLAGFAGPLAANGAALCATYLAYAVRPDWGNAVESFGVAHFHDTKYFAATLILVVSAVYACVRPRERAQAALFVAGAAGWWAGYLTLTRFGGLVLAPPDRSEGWGGCLGVFVVLLLYLARQRNFAGLRMALVGAWTGGAAFVLALAATHPLVVRYGPFAQTTVTDTWKITEETFGFLMGLGVAAAAVGLARGEIAPAAEDAHRRRSDTFAAFVLLVFMMWLNFAKNVRDWRDRYDILPHHEIAGLSAGQWFLVVGVAATLVALVALWRLRRGTLETALPATPFGKGAVLFLLVLWIAQSGISVHRFVEIGHGSNVLVEVSYWLLATLATGMLLELTPADETPETVRGAIPIEDRRWLPGRWYAAAWLATPLLVAASAALAMAMQEGPHTKGRLRFGPNAYWRTQQPAATTSESPASPAK